VTGMLSVESFNEALVGTNLGCCGCQSKGNWTWDGIDKYPFELLCFFSLLVHITSMSEVCHQALLRSKELPLFNLVHPLHHPRASPVILPRDPPSPFPWPNNPNRLPHDQTSTDWPVVIAIQTPLPTHWMLPLDPHMPHGHISQGKRIRRLRPHPVPFQRHNALYNQFLRI